MSETQAHEYRQWAKQCRAMAATVRSPKERQRWAELAEEMERLSKRELSRKNICGKAEISN